MGRKNQRKEQKRQALELVDEQKEPCLRALQKKVRNLNKKLTEIADLQTKQHLKPQQIDKIQKKPAVQQEKAKFLELIEIYKEIAKENEKSIRAIQLNELKDIAAVLAVRQYCTDSKLTQISDIESLVKVLSSPSTNLTLSERVEEITNHLLKVANNGKAKAKYLEFLKANPDATIEEQKAEELEEQPEQIAEQKVEQVEEPEAESKEQVKEAVAQAPKTQNVPEAVPEQANKEIPASETETKKEVISEVKAERDQNTENKTEEQKNGEGRRQYYKKKREYQKTVGQDNRPRNQYQKRDGNQERKNKTFKPKYAPKEEKNDDSDSISGESSPEVREFNREERKKMENDGFIFIAKKTKPKAREQKQWHDHQHGKKHHHHHHPNN